MDLDRLYHKIEPLFKFDHNTKKFIYGNFKNMNVRILKNNDWVFTEKVDGMNFRIIWDGYSLSYGGRTKKSEFSTRQKQFIKKELINKDLENLVEQTFGEKKVIIYGELYGNDIQKVGKLYSETYSFLVFDILVNGIFLERYKIDDSSYRDNLSDVCNTLGLKAVPILLVGTIQEALDFLDKEIVSRISDQAPLEGLVGVPVGNLLDRAGNRIIVKIKERDLKNKTTV